MVDGEAVSKVEIARSRSARRKGLLGRSGIFGAILLSPARSVHTFGMRFAIDVAHLDAQMRVLSITTMPPNRCGRFVWRARHVLETEAGMLEVFGIAQGTKIELRS